VQKNKGAKRRIYLLSLPIINFYLKSYPKILLSNKLLIIKNFSSKLSKKCIVNLGIIGLIGL
jgi:hypothetical protein